MTQVVPRAASGRRSRGRALLSLVIAVSLAFGAGLFVGRGTVGRGLRLPAHLDSLGDDLQTLIRRHAAVLSVEPDDAGSWARLGQVYEVAQIWDEALPCYLEAASLAPDDPVYALHAEVARAASGDHATAILHLEALCARFPDHAAVRDQLGTLLAETGEFERSEHQFQELIRREQFLPQAHAALGDLALRGGRAEEALAHLQQALELAPDFRLARHLRGLALTRLGREEEAEGDLLTGDEEAPRGRVPDRLAETLPIYSVTPSFTQRIAQNHMEGGRNALAVQILEAAAEWRPHDANLQAMLGSLYVKDGRPYRALEPLRDALAQYGEDAALRINYATALLMMDLPEQALAQADEVLAQQPDFVAAQLLRGRALRRLLRLEEAYHALRRVQELDPSNAGAASELNLVWRQGRELQAQGLLPTGVAPAESGAADDGDEDPR